MTAEQLGRALVLVHHDAADLGVDAPRGVLAVALARVEVAAEEHLLLAAGEVERAELVGHAPLGHHRSRQLGGPLDVVAGAGGLLAEDHFLGDATAHEDADRVLRELARHRQPVLGRELLRQAQRATARDDRHLVHRIGLGADEARDQGVTRLVDRGGALLLVGDDHRAALGAHQHLVLGLLEVDHVDLVLVATRGDERRLVDQALQIGAGETGRAAGDDLEIDRGRQRDAPDVDVQDADAAAQIRARHHDAAVEAPRTK